MLWSVGYGKGLAINAAGELYGLVDASSRQIGTASNWSQVVSGSDYSLAINTDGELYYPMIHYSRELVDGTVTSTSRSTRIGTASNWVKVAAGYSHSLAINADGELYAWGRNRYGQLGDGTNADKNTPTRIGTASNWVKVAAGHSHSLAINADGELYAWGYNRYGQLGDGTNGISTNKNRPTRIGTATNWSQVAAGGRHSLAINADGELYSWGCNSNGELGDGAIMYQATPAPVKIQKLKRIVKGIEK